MAMERLSTDLRINSGREDAAGLAIWQRMTADVRGLAVAIRNANDGLSLAQTAESAMGEVTKTLQRMRELAVPGINGVSIGSSSGDDDNVFSVEKASLALAKAAAINCASAATSVHAVVGKTRIKAVRPLRNSKGQTEASEGTVPLRS